MIHHPYQDMKVHVTSGQYAGTKGKVVRVLPDYGEHGFAEILFDGRGGRKPFIDLVPLPYLDYPRTTDSRRRSGGASDDARHTPPDGDLF